MAWTRRRRRDGRSRPYREMLNDLPGRLHRADFVTCRVLSYQDERWQLDEGTWPDYELARLDADKIDWFIAAWYGQLAALRGVSQTDADRRLIPDLKRAVRRRDLWRMARNPLLLTVMSLLHSRDKELPEEAASVYEEAVSLLLWRWETAKLPGREDQVTEWRSLLQEANLRDGDVLEVLRQLAFQAHRQMTSRPSQAEGEDEAESSPTSRKPNC